MERNHETRISETALTVPGVFDLLGREGLLGGRMNQQITGVEYARFIFPFRALRRCKYSYNIDRKICSMIVNTLQTGSSRRIIRITVSPDDKGDKNDARARAQRIAAPDEPSGGLFHIFSY